jgi:hypothetical protein
MLPGFEYFALGKGETEYDYFGEKRKLFSEETHY